MTRRALPLLRRLPTQIQAFVFWGMKEFALFFVLILVSWLLIHLGPMPPTGADAAERTR